MYRVLDVEYLGTRIYNSFIFSTSFTFGSLFGVTVWDLHRLLHIVIAESIKEEANKQSVSETADKKQTRESIASSFCVDGRAVQHIWKDERFCDDLHRSWFNTCFPWTKATTGRTIRFIYRSSVAVQQTRGAERRDSLKLSMAPQSVTSLHILAIVKDRQALRHANRTTDRDTDTDRQRERDRERERKKERKKDILTSSKANIGPWDKWFTNGIFTHASKVKLK